MFGNQSNSLLAANFTPEQLDVINQCLLDLVQQGHTLFVQDQKRNSNPKTYGTVEARTNRGKTAILVSQGDAVFNENIFVGGNTIYNGSGTSIAFRNDSGETVPTGGVMQPTGYVVRQGTRYLTITKPYDTTGDAPQKWGANTYPRFYGINSGDPVRNGQTGVCCTTGFSLALLDTPGNALALDGGWGAKPGQWSLTQGFDGFTVMGGVAEANGLILVEQREIVNAHGVLVGSIAASGNQKVTINGAGNTATGFAVQAYDGLLIGGKKLTNGTNVDLVYRYGNWYITGADLCPVPV